TEFEPAYLFAGVPRGDVEALTILYPGWGSSSYLAPSPSPQLLGALLTTAHTKVFSLARCFTASIRDGYTSAEELALFAYTLGVGIDDLITLAERFLKRLFTDLA